MIRTIDLCCGAGGLSLGARSAGAEIRLAVDSSQACISSYRQNHPGVPALVHDLTDVDLTMSLVRKHVRSSPDLIVAAPPCRDFSSAGRLSAHRETHAPVFNATIETIVRCRPADVLIENVEGLITFLRGRLLATALHRLVESGYWVCAWKLDAADFGVAQHRKRLLIYASRRPFTSPSPLARLGWEPGLPVSVAMALGSLPRAEPSRKRPGAKRAEPGAAITEHVYFPPAARVLARMQALGPGQCLRDLGAEWQYPSHAALTGRRAGGLPAGLRRLDPEGAAPTLVGRSLRLLTHPFEDRAITLREALRLQGAPDAFRVDGTHDERAAQVGDLVPPPMAQRIVSAVLERSGDEGATGAPRIVDLGLSSIKGRGQISAALRRSLAEYDRGARALNMAA